MAKVYGVEDLHTKLKALDFKENNTVLRRSMRSAMLPALKAAQAAAPVGSVFHRTYRGRLVAPGFSKRSLKVVVARDEGTGQFRAVLGVLKEGFYAIQFGEYGSPARGIPRTQWFSKSFEDRAEYVEKRFEQAMLKQITKIASKKGTR